MVGFPANLQYVTGSAQGGRPMNRSVFATHSLPVCCAFALLATSLISQPATAFVTYGCSTGVRSDITTNISTDNLVTFTGTSGFVCDVNDFVDIETGAKGNSASAAAATGSGATAGVGVSFFNPGVTVEAESRAQVTLEFYIRKTDPLANNALIMDFDMEVFTQHFTLIGTEPFNVSYIKRRGEIAIFDEGASGFPQGPKNDVFETTVNASHAPGAVTTLSGDASMFVDRLSAVRLTADVRVRGSASSQALPEGGEQDGYGTASFGVAVSAALYVPAGYELEFLTGNVPQLGVHPYIDPPPASVPLPPAMLMLDSGLIALLSLRGRTNLSP